MCNGLANARNCLLNEKPHKILGVVNLDVIYNWGKRKGIYNWINVIFEDLDPLCKSDHLNFGFKTGNLQDIQNFQFIIMDSDSKNIEFVGNEKKVSILNFKIKVLN